MRTILSLLAGLVAAQTVWAASLSYLPGRLSVRFLEHPPLESRQGAVSLGSELDRLLADHPPLTAAPLIPNMTRATWPDLSLNYVLTFDPALDMEAVADLLSASGRVEYAEPDWLLPLRRTPNDPGVGQQWTMTRVQAYQAWDLIPETPSNPEMVIAIIDSGVDWNHPDLINRLWHNPDEDLDGDEVVPSTGSTPGESDERNATDDGGNGFVDDFYGWDFVTGVTGCANGEDCADVDNNSMDFDGHGTHCAGIAAAQTNNSLGVASISWDGRIMCLRAGYHAADGNGYVVSTAASSALYYAINNGAKIVSMSFGGSGSIRTAATAAYNAGLLCFHASGNESSSEQDALDRATGMVSVAATTSNDCAASFTNYGEWIDVSAPGTSIYSTYFNNTYASLDGTSMACPNAASCAALIWWMNPELTNVEVRERLLGTVDNIYNLSCNSDYADPPQLGTGRINAYKALMNIRETAMTLSGMDLVDLDGDGHYLAGDTLQVVWTLTNTGINPTQQLTLHLACDDPALEVLTPETVVPELGAGGVMEGTESPLWLRVVDDNPNYATASLQVTAANAATQSGSATGMLGLPTILLYDDSAAETGVVTYYKAAFQQLGWILDWYQASTQSFPDLTGMSLDLSRYEWVLYASGANTSTLDAAEQTLLTDYLSTGGHDLILVSQHADEEINGTAFFSQVLEAVDGSATSTTRGAKGVADTFTAGISMILQGAGGANNQAVPISEITPAADGQTIFQDNANAFSTGILNGWGDNRVVYLSFALEAAGGAGSSLNTGEVLQILVDQYLNATSVDEPAAGRPVSDRLLPAWPNPFNPDTRLAFELSRSARARLSVHNVLGQEVAVLQDGPLAAGSHQRVFQGGALPSGLYLVNLSVDGRPAQQQKILLVK